MWQEVNQGDLAQLQTFVDVLREQNVRFQNAQQLQEWLQSHRARLFYFSDPGHEIALGFSHDDSAGEWRVRLGGVRGGATPAAGKTLVDKIVDFMHSGGLPAVIMYSMSRSATDQDRAMINAAAELLRQHPDIAEVSSRPSSIGRYFRATLRPTA